MIIETIALAFAEAPSASIAEAPIPTCKETSEPAGILTVTIVDNADGDAFGVLMVLIDYPENLVFIPGAADEAEMQAVVTDRPVGAQCVVNDRDHTLQVGCLSVTGFPEGACSAWPSALCRRRGAVAVAILVQRAGGGRHGRQEGGGALHVEAVVMARVNVTFR